MQGEGCLILPRSSTGTILLDLHPEAEHTFSTFGVDDGVAKTWTKLLMDIVYNALSYMGHNVVNETFWDNFIIRSQIGFIHT